MKHYYLFEGGTQIRMTPYPNDGLDRDDWIILLQKRGERVANTTINLEKYLNKKGKQDGDELFYDEDFIIAAVSPSTEINET